MTTSSRSRRLGLLVLAAALPLSLAAAGVASADVARAGAAQAARADQPWLNTSLTPEGRAAMLVDAMTLAQKFQQLTGTPPEIVPELPECYGGRHVRGIAELGIPTLRITNGPVGVGQNDCVDAALIDLPPAQRPLGVPYVHPSSAKATALPSATTAAASFDPDVAGTYGDVIGTEMNNLALHVFEAPGVNMARLPILGRNFEYFGEDPFLAGTMAVAETKAVQGKGLIAMPKHYAANEQETNRQVTNSVVDERTLHETYLLPFEMAVKDGDAASVMCAYNYVNGVPSCENEYLLEDVLREQWGFQGYVQSDFFATKSTVPTLLNGMDHMMPVPQQWAPDLLQAALDAGQISVGDIDLALERRYVQMFKYGIFDRPLVQTPIDYDAGGEKAYQIGAQGAVLLQNNGALPIRRDVQDIVVVGKATQVYAQQAVAGGARVGQPFGSGGGSSDVVPVHSVDPVEGLQNTLRELGNTTGRVRLVLVDDANQTATIDGQAVSFQAALAEAAGADSVVIMAGTISEEGADRATFADATGTQLVDIGDDLDWYADNLTSIATVAGRNPAKNSNTVAMIKAVMGAESFDGREDRAGAQGQRRRRDGPGVRGQARPVDPGGVVPRPGGRQHRRRPAVRCRQSLGQVPGHLPLRRQGLPRPHRRRAFPGEAGRERADPARLRGQRRRHHRPADGRVHRGREHRLPLVRRERQRQLPDGRGRVQPVRGLPLRPRAVLHRL